MRTTIASQADALTKCNSRTRAVSISIQQACQIFDTHVYQHQRKRTPAPKREPTCVAVPIRALLATAGPATPIKPREPRGQKRTQSNKGGSARPALCIVGLTGVPRCTQRVYPYTRGGGAEGGGVVCTRSTPPTRLPPAAKTAPRELHKSQWNAPQHHGMLSELAARSYHTSLKLQKQKHTWCVYSSGTVNCFNCDTVAPRNVTLWFYLLVSVDRV